MCTNTQHRLHHCSVGFRFKASYLHIRISCEVDILQPCTSTLLLEQVVVLNMDELLMRLICRSTDKALIWVFKSFFFSISLMSWQLSSNQLCNFRHLYFVIVSVQFGLFLLSPSLFVTYLFYHCANKNDVRNNEKHILKWLMFLRRITGVSYYEVSHNVLSATIIVLSN